MTPPNISLTKRALIDKANARIVVYVSIAAFILIFSLVTLKTLTGQMAYQNRLISKKRDTVNQLKTDLDATSKLKTAYTAFTSTPQNVIGGSTAGTGQNDGDNAKIVLDALPSNYDFPGLATSLDALLSTQGVKISGITGTDDEIAQSGNTTSAAPQPVPMPFSVSATGNYGGIQNVVNVLERSIRPMQIQTLSITGAGDSLQVAISAQTYYQPAKKLQITKETVK